MLVREVVIDAGLLQASNNTWLRTGADDTHRVSLLLELGQLLWCAWAWLALLTELLGDAAEFLCNVVVEFLRSHGEVVLLLQADAHATEVLANEVVEERLGGVPGVDVVLLHDLVGQVGASLEGEVLTEAEGVVAVEEDILDLAR